MPPDHLQKVLAIARRLTDDPRPRNVGAKRGPLRGLLGIALGRFRILYRVDDARHVVEIARVRDRKEAYR